jgi:hypothetical protein
MKSLQKDFNNPPPIGVDLENGKPGHAQRKAPVLPSPLAPPAPAQTAPPAPPPQVPVMLMMMPQGLPPHCLPAMPLAMQHPMMAGAAPQGAGSPTAAAPGLVMMPMMQPMAPMAQMAAPGSVRPVDATMAPNLGMSIPMDPSQYGARQFGMPDCREAAGAYPQRMPQSPSFRDICSPSYQSSQAYNQYVRDIMNADGDEFQFA